jgi:hypothetical protein
LRMILAWDKARGGRISAVIFDRRATRSQAKSSATLRARVSRSGWRRCRLLTAHCGAARRRRLAIHSLKLSRDPLQFFNRLLGHQDAVAQERGLKRGRGVALLQPASRPLDAPGLACAFRRRETRRVGSIKPCGSVIRKANDFRPLSASSARTWHTLRWGRVSSRSR